jgi:hypothetical protein
MYDQASRSLWLEDQLWRKLRDEFPQLQAIPQEVMITVGYPSSGARGQSSKIKPAEINYQWTGNANEKAAIFVHPVYLDKPINAAKALLFAGAKVTLGARWGPSHVGLEKKDTGEIVATSATEAKLLKILEEIGDPPSGFGKPFPIRNVDRARLRLYVPATTRCLNPTTGDVLVHTKVRSANDNLQVACTVCGTPYVKG